MSVKISKTNSKLGVIPSINLPPIVTCRPNCPCSKDCYATKGRFRFPNVKDNMNHNYAAYLANPDEYFDDICKSINDGMVSYSYFRWHASGDIIDERYFKGMVEVAKKLPHTSFLAFTKKYEIVNDYIRKYGEVPPNLHIVLSAWGASFRLDNRYSLPVAHVRFANPEEDSTIPEAAIECSGNCQTCLRCWNIKSGQSVVFNQH